MTFFQIPFTSSVLGPNSSLSMQRRHGKSIAMQSTPILDTATQLLDG